MSALSESNGGAIVRIESRIPEAVEINDLARLANHLSKSGFFRDAAGGYQAFAKLLFGRDLGLSATAAMTGVHIVEGKPEIGANIQAQMVRTYTGPEGERYDYRVLKHTAAECEIEFSRRREGRWQVLGVSRYTIEDAKTANLAHKDNYRRHPRNMLFARAMSDGVAFHCPEVTNGIRTYHEGEIDRPAGPALTVIDGAPDVPTGIEPVNADGGEVIDGTVVIDPEPAPEPVAPQPTAKPPSGGERPANAKQKAMLHGIIGRARAVHVDGTVLANAMLAAISDEQDRNWESEESAGRWLDRQVDRLPGSLVTAAKNALSPFAPKPEGGRS